MESADAEVAKLSRFAELAELAALSSLSSIPCLCRPLATDSIGQHCLALMLALAMALAKALVSLKFRPSLLVCLRGSSGGLRRRLPAQRAGAASRVAQPVGSWRPPHAPAPSSPLQ